MKSSDVTVENAGMSLGDHLAEAGFRFHLLKENVKRRLHRVPAQTTTESAPPESIPTISAERLEGVTPTPEFQHNDPWVVPKSPRYEFSAETLKPKRGPVPHEIQRAMSLNSLTHRFGNANSKG